MALVASSWEIQVGKGIRYVGAAHGVAGANYVTVLELHRWLQDLADDASSAGDDYMDITRDTPSDKSFDTIISLTNGYTLDTAYTTPANEYIYGGTIIQGGGTDIWDGIAVVANRGCYVDVIQDGARLTGDFWNNTPNGESYRGINFDAATGKSAQFMVKVRASGADIDGKILLFQTREWGKTYSEFRIPGTGRGVNTVPLTYKNDLNNTTIIGDLVSAPFTTVTNVTTGYNLIDVDNNGADEEYYSEWDKGDCTINQFYEYMKYITRRTASATVYGTAGELFRGITHSVTYTGLAGGAFAQGTSTDLTWGTGATAGTGRILADDTTDDILYIQLLTGVVPTGTITQGGVTATTGTVTEKAVSTPACGDSTGSSIVGAYGFSLEYADLAKNDKITALDGTTRQPPNNVTFTVSGLTSGYSVLVAPSTGSAIQVNQFTLNGALSGAAVTSVVVNEAIPVDTPAVATGVGSIRILRANGQYTKHEYTAYNSGTKTFTIPAHDFSTNGAANGANAYLGYIDAVANATDESYSCVYSAARTLAVRVRFGGTGPAYSDSIKTYQTFTASLGESGGGSSAAVVSDA